MPPQAGTADRVYGGASETPPVSPGFAVGGDMPSSLARTPRTQQALELSSSSQPGRLSTAMERVIRLERKRAGKVGLQRRIFAMRCGVRARPRLIARSKSAAETTCGAGSHTGAQPYCQEVDRTSIRSMCVTL